MSASASKGLVHATVLLFTMFGVYPLLYLVQVLVTPASDLVVWAVIVQAGFSLTDVIAKIGFGSMIHRVAKLRTAEDVNDGIETHPEPVWIAHELYSEAWSPLESMLADGSRRGTRVRGVRPPAS